MAQTGKDATSTLACCSLYPDITVSYLSDAVTGLPTGIVFGPGANHGVSWTVTFQGIQQSGNCVAATAAVTVSFVGAVLATDLSEVTVWVV